MPEVGREPRGLVQIVAGAETAVTRIVARMEIPRGDFCKTLAKGDRNGRFAAKCRSLHSLDEAGRSSPAPSRPRDECNGEPFKYRTEVNLSAGLGSSAMGRTKA